MPKCVGAFLAGPVMKTLSSHCRGSDSAPGQGSKLSHATGHGQEQNNRKSASVRETDVREAREGRREDSRGGRGLACTCSGGRLYASLPSGSPPQSQRVCRLESAPVQAFTLLPATNSTDQGMSFSQKASLPVHNGVNPEF